VHKQQKELAIKQCDLLQDNAPLNFDDECEDVFEYLDRLVDVLSRIGAFKI
jgi:hypothetical protein